MRPKMAGKGNYRFPAFEDFAQAWYQGDFDCDSIADFNDPLVLDWCSRLEDWAPKVALCFNRFTGAVTLDRISQHEMPELRRLTCFHRNVSVETLQRLLGDSDQICRETAQEYLEKRSSSPKIWKSNKKSRVRN